MQKARQIVAQTFLGASEREIVPGNRDFFEHSGFSASFVGTERPGNSRGSVDDNDGRSAGIRIDIDQSVDVDLESAFFPSLTKRGSSQGLTTVDVSTWEHPFA